MSIRGKWPHENLKEPAPPGGHEHHLNLEPGHVYHGGQTMGEEPRRQATLPEIVAAVEHEAIAVVNAALGLARALDVKADLSTGAKTPMPPMTLGARLVQTSHDLSAAAEMLRRALAML